MPAMERLRLEAALGAGAGLVRVIIGVTVYRGDGGGSCQFLIF